jgi:transposase-like protein
MSKERRAFKTQRRYSESLKKKVVDKFEKGEWTVLEACRIYDIKSKQTVYEWIYRYSRTLKKSTRLVLEEDSIDKRLKDLEARKNALEAALGRKQMELDLYKHILDLASEAYDVDLKKSFGDQVLKGKSK